MQLYPILHTPIITKVQYGVMSHITVLICHGYTLLNCGQKAYSLFVLSLSTARVTIIIGSCWPTASHCQTNEPQARDVYTDFMRNG